MVGATCRRLPVSPARLLSRAPWLGFRFAEGRGTRQAVLGPARAPTQGTVGPPPGQTARLHVMGTVLRTQLDCGDLQQGWDRC